MNTDKAVEESPRHTERALSVWNWVPQLFYDLIAKGIPGAFLLGVFPFVWNGPKSAGADVAEWLSRPAGQYPSVAFFLILLPIIYYSLSTICLGIWFLVLGYALWLFDKLTRVRNLFETGFPSNQENLGEIYESVKIANASAGNRITKLKAELHMSGALFVGLFAAIIAWFFVGQYEHQCFVMCLLILELDTIAAIGCSSPD